MNFDIDSIKGLLDGMDPAALLPDVSGIVGTIAAVCRIAILAGPIVLVLLGLGYLLFAPKEANYYFGYRTTFGMGSVKAWRHTQKVAGFLFFGVGAVLLLIMFVVSANLGGMEAMDMVWTSVKCLVWQAVLTVVINMAVGSIAAMTFDYKGNKRHF